MLNAPKERTLLIHQAMAACKAVGTYPYAGVASRRAIRGTHPEGQPFIAFLLTELPESDPSAQCKWRQVRVVAHGASEADAVRAVREEYVADLTANGLMAALEAMRAVTE